MKNFVRVTLFGSFAAVGAGVAVCIGSAKLPSAAPEPAPAPQLAVRTVTEEEPSAGPRQPDAASRRTPSSEAASAVWHGPTLAQVSPQLGQQSAPAADDTRLQDVFEYLRRQLDTEPSATGVAATAPSPKVLPPPPPSSQLPPSSTSSPPVPPPVNLAPPPQGVSGRTAAAPDNVQAPASTGGEAASSAKDDRSTPKTSIDAEGDGKLSIHIQNADIREVLDLLGEQGNINILAGNKVQGKVSATLTGVDIQSALDAILKSAGLTSRRDGKFVFVGTPEDFTSLEQSLDRIGMRVYRPNYVTAADLQKLIQPMLTGNVGVVSVSTAAEKGIGADSNSAGGNNFAGTDAVVVRDYEAVLATVDQIVAEVDVRPMQVHIEAMILSVHLKDSDRYGVNFQLLRNNPDVAFALGNPPSSLANITFQEGALKFGFLDSSLGSFLEALETIGDTNVIATPHLMVLNKHRAEIQIGEQKGYVSTTVTETSTTQAVQFLDVGALLRLRPFISSDGLIRMELHPELSDGTVETSSGFTLPQKQVTQVTTNIMVRDGCTVVIGGLMQENLTTTTNQLPLLGNLPLVGFLFRTSTEGTERREVIVLITPHIVYEPETCQEGEKAACEYHRREAVYSDKMTPINKRSMGRRYFRLAQSAWSAGDRDTALRFAEMSVHFDPLNRAAIDLRSDIWQNRHSGEQTLGSGDAAAAPATAMDKPEMADWMLNDLEHEPATTPAPLHPLDPGQPGRRVEINRPRLLQ